jgi:hypothetical protein
MAVTDPGPEPGADRRPTDPGRRHAAGTHSRGWYVLLLAPFVALLWVSTYASHAPVLWGFPFFYWYQFLWVLLGAGATALVYRLTTGPDQRAEDDRERRP